MKITSFSLRHFRNDEDYTFQKSFADLAKKYLTENSMITTATAKQLAAITAYDSALNKVSGESKAVLATQADEERDHAWSGANAYLYTLANFCPDDKMKTAAFEIYTLFSKFGNPTQIASSTETSRLQNLIDSIQALPTKTISDSGFTLWYNALVSKHNQYISAANVKNATEAAVIVGNVKNTRAAVDAAYKEAVAVVNAVASIQSTKKIETFISELNNLIAQAKAVIKARKTMAENAEDADAELDAPVSSETVTE